MTAAVMLGSAAMAVAMPPVATPASAAGTWTLTLGTPTGITTTGFVANGTVTSDGNAGFVEVLYAPAGTPLTPSSPSAGLVIFNAGETGPQPVSIPIDQLTPNTSYAYILEATEDDNAATFFSIAGIGTTTTTPTGPGTPIDPPAVPSSNGIFGQCSGDGACVNDMNGVRAAQEQLPPLTLPSNWGTLTGPEQMFVWTNLERTSRGEVAIPDLVTTFNSAVAAGLADDADPSLSNLPGNSASIWAGAYATVLGAINAWMYDDGPGGENGDCTTPASPGCWGHRDNMLADAATFGNPTEMDAGVGTDSGGNADYDAIFVVDPAPTNIVFTWAQEQSFLGGEPNFAPSISGVTITGTAAAPEFTVTGSNFGATAPTATPVACQDVSGNTYGFGGLAFQDTGQANFGAGEAGDCLGLFVISWSNTAVVFTFGNAYPFDYGPIVAGDQIQVTVQGATDTLTAALTGSAPTVTGLSPAAGPTSGGTSVTITGTGFTGATAVTFGGFGATNVHVVNATTITATSPGYPSAGVHSVQVTTPAGTSAKAAAANFTYQSVPTVTGLSPAAGPTAGGTNVTITGTGFLGATAVTFGGFGGSHLTVVNATTITVTSPGYPSAGVHSVQVTTPAGTSAKVAAANFTYQSVPTVTALSPAAGPTSGGTSVTITGTGFLGATAVTFGGFGASHVVVVNATTITATSPAYSAGAHSVQVTTAAGTSAKVAAANFTYESMPGVTGVSPNSGPTAGGTSVTITGTGFTGATAVTFGGFAATNVDVINATTITATSPGYPSAGVHSVQVTTPAGTSAKVAAADFTYT